MSADAEEYIFRFDAPLERVIPGGAVDVHGWLLHRDGKPIHGIRALAKRTFRKPEILRGRRKRKRSDIAAAFPEIAGAEDSGFLLELRLGFGRNQLEFQVLNHERRWQTFEKASVFSVPLTSVGRSGFPRVREFLVFYLGQLLAKREPEASRAPAELREARKAAGAEGIKKVDLFATSRSNLFILEIGELVAAGFRELGCEARLHLDEIPSAEPASDALQIVVTPHEYYNLFLTERLSRADAQALTGGVYLLSTEQPDTGWFHSNLLWTPYARGIADINPLGVASYHTRNFHAQRLQLGYHSVLRYTENAPHAQRRHEITFLGSITERREKFFARHADFFAAHRCHIRFVPLGFAKTKQTRSYLDAASRNALLNDTRILLNVHYSEQKYFEWHRILVALANGCCIVTETCRGYGPLVPGKHFVMVDAEYLATACEYYLAHPDECEAIADAGRAFVETELRQSQGCAAFLAEIADPTTQRAEFRDPTPAPYPEKLRNEIGRYTASLARRAFKQDMRALFHPASDANATAQTASDDELRSAIINKRQAYRSRLREQEETRVRGESVLQLHDNAAYAQTCEPKLSVVVTLYNYAQHIEECVASATRAAAELSAAAEIVVVNDASTDDSLARAFAAQRTTTVAMRIVDKRFNTGLADARNTGIQLARAPYIFMLDADNLVVPNALAELLGLISSGEYAAAYSILSRFSGEPANRIGLLSEFDWDPQILVQHPYIDAMAMFSRAALLELGGYDNELSQIGWFGWEDYDMWLRFAQRDLRVGFVPNMLCLYRHHETSMINSTNLFELDLVRHFMERFGDLLARFEPRDTAFGVERSKILEMQSRAGR